MEKKNLWLPYFLTFCFLLIQLYSFSQRPYNIGLYGTIEKNNEYALSFNTGISIERKFCQRNSVGVTVGYRHFQNDFSYENTDFVLLKNFSVSENYLSACLYNKYDLKFMTIALGASADILASWKNQSPVSYPYKNYLDHKAYWGLLAKAGKIIKIANQFTVEPEICYNPIFTPYTLYSKYTVLSGRQYAGFGITARYHL